MNTQRMVELLDARRRISGMLLVTACIGVALVAGSAYGKCTDSCDSPNCECSENCGDPTCKEQCPQFDPCECEDNPGGEVCGKDCCDSETECCVQARDE